ncbi:hypothetical protein CAI21_01765 [Alkalilimnicola ehrlichii]|uniref:ABC-type transport auxiliary lipoprotein component domain-containing protein n=1 Tax=Alkalilimnicola ehrlichii TaxID=351052 RepID=A0A3E0X492_9GAMM|nr:ABC-type transport auxiliary lipoprotein family protein [Alkalilimnicola ehrlichii]RFA31370.1 hypothetical protein CAI21_01765 [Alkalilimnicola ehrlichii]RFA39356.1 hypothetical protein CAL65_00640 [Alkalilimnicola ehrlichii]
MKISRAKRLVGLVATSSVMALSACNVLPQATPVDVYRLPPAAIVSPPEQARIDWSLRVARPQAIDLLNSSRIAVADGTRLNVYESARWSASATELWRDHVLDVFQQDGRFAEVSSDEEGVRADYELTGILRAFYSERTAEGREAVIVVDARLVDLAQRRTVQAQRFEVREQAADGRLSSVVDAFGEAADRLALELLDWTLGAAMLQRTTY